MGEAARKLLEEVLQLPRSEREELATELLASFDGDPDESWFEAWDRELEERLMDLEAHPESSTPWELVRDQLRLAFEKP